MKKNIIIAVLVIIIILLLAFIVVNKLGTIYIPLSSDIYDITVLDDDKVIVYDKDNQKINEAPLKIFEHNSYHTKKDVISPGTESTYQFVIRNNNDFTIIYDLEINETNDYDINMKFRLKQNGKYILGDNNNWVTASELKQSGEILADNSYNVYHLDWKWFESDNDTEIGETIDAHYKLGIGFYSKRY